MAQQEPNLRDYWWVVRRRKWIVLTVPLLLAAVTYVATYLRAPAPLYRATAVAKFERTFSVNTLLLRDIIGVSPIGDLETNAALVKSFPVLSRAALELGLVPRGEGAPGGRAELQAAVQRLAGQIEVTRTERTSLIEITATAHDPEVAARLANGVAEAFQANDMETRTYQIVEARRFIEAQLADVGRRLQESEERLRTFQEGNKVLLLQDEARAVIGRLAEQRGEQERIERDMRAIEVQLQTLSDDRAADGAAPAEVVGADANLAKLQATLSDLILERDTLLLTLRPNHPNVRGLQAKIENVRRELKDVVAANRTRLRKTLAARLQVLRARSAQVSGAIGSLDSRAATMPAVALEAARLEREVKLNERIFSLLKERLQEALIKEKEQVAEVTIVRPAVAVTTPVNEPEPGRRALLGLILGAVLGLALAFVAEALDTSIGAIHDLESLLETPILGVMPYFEEASDPQAFLPTVFAPRSPIAEATRGLRTGLLFRILDRDIKTLVVTSAAQGEGKTTVAINLAASLAQLGKKTLLVEADLRNPTIRRVFGIRRDPGLTDVVLGSVSLDDAALNFADLMLGKEGMEDLLDSPGMDNFFLLPSGLRAPNPSELVGSQGFAAFLAAARERYDYVILDSTPVLAVADASIIAAQADGILCMVRVGSVPRAALRRAKGILAAAKTEFLGVCLNGVKAEVSPDFHELAYYKYRYGPPKPPTRVRPALAALVSHPAVTPQHIAAGVVGLLALTGGVWALGRLAAPAPTPVQSPRPAPRPAKRATPAPAPVRRETSAPVIQVRRELYSVAVPSGNGGQVLIGQFETEDEAASFGAALLGEGITSSYRVVPAEP
jgi:capsular exopolysaccharide synthesis family protein